MRPVVEEDRGQAVRTAHVGADRRRRWIIAIAAAAIVRLCLAAFVTNWVLVDDAYITLRYARQFALEGTLVYNQGEQVFGVTSPLWAFVTSALMASLALVGAGGAGGTVGAGGAEVAVVLVGVALWSHAALRLVSLLADPFRNLALPLFLCAPVFVDNQMLGMETPMFVWLAIHAVGAAQEGRIRSAAGWAGALAIARPEGILFAPTLLWVGSASIGLRCLLRELTRPLVALRLIGPGLAWIAFATVRYGTFVPQSMVAKSGWNSVHYDALGTLENAWFGLARLTFLPFVDYLPGAVAHLAVAAVAALVLLTVWANVRGGSTASRGWLCAYGTYVTFYLVGKGATEASWYAVPSSVALLLAMEPAVPARVMASRPLMVATAVAAASLSVALVVRRAPLLHSYVEGYGACASALEAASPGGLDRVLIGEIGVFGFRTSHRLIDVGALVSPEVLPLKNRGVSLVGLARATNADWLVVSDIALERNIYPSVGEVWANDDEHGWLAEAVLVHHARDKRLLRLPRAESQSQTVSAAIPVGLPRPGASTSSSARASSDTASEFIPAGVFDRTSSAWLTSPTQR